MPAECIPWLRRNYSWLLSLFRGVVNMAVVTFGLMQVSYVLGASIAEGCAAGLQSALLQVSAVNERYARFLNAATTEGRRFGRWAVIGVGYYAVVKLAGLPFGGGPSSAGQLARMLAITVVFGTAQYPWVSAIALRRVVEARRRARSQTRIRFSADVQVMAVSTTCVAVSALNSVGVPSSRLILLVMGVVGTIYYRKVRGHAQVISTAAPVKRSDRKSPSASLAAASE